MAHPSAFNAEARPFVPGAGFGGGGGGGGQDFSNDFMGGMGHQHRGGYGVPQAAGLMAPGGGRGSGMGGFQPWQQQQPMVGMGQPSAPGGFMNAGMYGHRGQQMASPPQQVLPSMRGVDGSPMYQQHMAPRPPQLLQLGQQGAGGNGCVEAYDAEVKAQLPVPFEALFQTSGAMQAVSSQQVVQRGHRGAGGAAAGSNNKAKLCAQFTTGGMCRLGENCRDLHALPNAIEEARGQVYQWMQQKESEFLSQPEASYKVFYSDLKEVISVPATALAFTRGLFLDPADREKRPSGGSHPRHNPTIAQQAPTACGLYANDPLSCKWGKFCNQAHVSAQWIHDHRRQFEEWSNTLEAQFDALPEDASFSIHDPLRRAILRVPKAKVATFTRGLLQSTNDKCPSVCLLSLQNRCTAGSRCNQAHIDPVWLNEYSDAMQPAGGAGGVAHPQQNIHMLMGGDGSASLGGTATSYDPTPTNSRQVSYLDAGHGEVGVESQQQKYNVMQQPQQHGSPHEQQFHQQVYPQTVPAAGGYGGLAQAAHRQAQQQQQQQPGGAGAAFAPPPPQPAGSSPNGAMLGAPGPVGGTTRQGGMGGGIAPPAPAGLSPLQQGTVAPPSQQQQRFSRNRLSPNLVGGLVPSTPPDAGHPAMPTVVSPIRPPGSKVPGPQPGGTPTQFGGWAAFRTPDLAGADAQFPSGMLNTPLTGASAVPRGFSFTFPVSQTMTGNVSPLMQSTTNPQMRVALGAFDEVIGGGQYDANNDSMGSLPPPAAPSNVPYKQGGNFSQHRPTALVSAGQSVTTPPQQGASSLPSTPQLSAKSPSRVAPKNPRFSPGGRPERHLGPPPN